MLLPILLTAMASTGDENSSTAPLVVPDFDCCTARSEPAWRGVKILLVPVADTRALVRAEAEDPSAEAGRTLDDGTKLPRPLSEFVTDALADQLRAAGHDVRIASSGPAPGENAADWYDLKQLAEERKVRRVVHGVIARWTSIDGGATVDLLGVGARSNAPWVGSVSTQPSDPTGQPDQRFRRGLETWSATIATPETASHTYFISGRTDARAVVRRARPVPVAGLPEPVDAPEAPPDVPVVTLDDVPVVGLPEQSAGLPPVAPPVEPGGVPQGVAQPGLPPPPPPIPTAGMPEPAPKVKVVKPVDAAPQTD